MSAKYPYSKDKVFHFYTNQVTNTNDPYLTLAIQVNASTDKNVQEPQGSFDNAAAEWGRITIWHVKTTIPDGFKGKVDDRMAKLDKPSPTAPVFAGEVKYFDINDSFVVPRDPIGGKVKNPEAVTHVPYIMLQPNYQKFGLSPLLWWTVYELAARNSVKQIAEWKAEKFPPPGASKTKVVTEEPPVGIVEVDLPTPELKTYWEKVGFNYLAKTHESAWVFEPDVIKLVNDIADGKKTEATKWIDKQVTLNTNPGARNAGPNSIKTALDYMKDIADLGRQKFTRLASFQG